MLSSRWNKGEDIMLSKKELILLLKAVTVGLLATIALSSMTVMTVGIIMLLIYFLGPLSIVFIVIFVISTMVSYDYLKNDEDE
jgi:hypothetical protein